MLIRANHTHKKSHETSSADCTLGPRGIGAVGSTRCMTASSGPTCCGGPEKKSEQTEDAPASMVCASRMWNATAWRRTSRNLPRTVQRQPATWLSGDYHDRT